jgi:predicted ArsR family transcriptional regulator
MEIRHDGVVESVAVESEARGGVASLSLEERDEGRTRDRVARLLLDLGPSSAATLGEQLGLSPAAIRRHLDAMLADGTIMVWERRRRGPRRRGRPARLFALSEQGHAAGPAAYDELAHQALHFLAEAAGEPAVREFADRRARELEHRLDDVVADLGSRGDPAQRASAVAEALSSAGYAATVSTLPSGTQLCQHHCPVHSVATEFPQMCEAETEALSRLLGTHVQRLATIAHGDGVCTTHIPVNAPMPLTRTSGKDAE